MVRKRASKRAVAPSQSTLVATTTYAAAPALPSPLPAPTATPGIPGPRAAASRSIQRAALPIRSRAPTALVARATPRSLSPSRQSRLPPSTRPMSQTSPPRQPLAAARSRQTPARPLPPEVSAGAHRTIQLLPAAIPPTEPARAPSPATSQGLP